MGQGEEHEEPIRIKFLLNFHQKNQQHNCFQLIRIINVFVFLV